MPEGQYMPKPMFYRVSLECPLLFRTLSGRYALVKAADRFHRVTKREVRFVPYGEVTSRL
ncbi:TPA: hypothetical protein EYP44_04925 [Candidatus Bathyarchaeota archaeon]|nr:hypothetical protein [Candidatus Bathyarchaeota archaeon]